MSQCTAHVILCGSVCRLNTKFLGRCAISGLFSKKMKHLLHKGAILKLQHHCLVQFETSLDTLELLQHANWTVLHDINAMQHLSAKKTLSCGVGFCDWQCQKTSHTCELGHLLCHVPIESASVTFFRFVKPDLFFIRLCRLWGKHCYCHAQGQAYHASAASFAGSWVARSCIVHHVLVLTVYYTEVSGAAQQTLVWQAAITIARVVFTISDIGIASTLSAECISIVLTYEEESKPSSHSVD